MSRRRRAALLVLGIPLAVLMLAGATLTWMLATESGSRWAVEQARPYLPEGVGFGSFEGVLAGPFVLGDVVVERPEIHAEVARLRVDWSPADLFWTEVRVTELTAIGVDIRLPDDETPEAQAGGTLPQLPDEVLLPVRVVVERLRVEDITVTAGEGTQRIDAVALRASAGPEGFALTDLEVAAPSGSITGSVRLDAGRPFGLDGRLGWRLRPPDPQLAEFSGTLRLGGSLRRLQARLEVREPQTAILRLEARPFESPFGWSGSLESPVSALRGWWGGAPELSAGVDLELAGGLDEARVEGRADVEGLPAGPVSARLKLRASSQAVVFERLHLEAEQRPDAFVEASGRIESDGATPRFDVRAAWNDLAWPLDGDALVSSESGSLELEGVADDYAIRVRGRLRSPQTGAEPVVVEARARGSTESLQGVQATARWHEATLEAKGSVRWAPDGGARVTLDLDGLDPQRIAEPLAGRLSARANLSAEWGDTVRGRLELERVEGTLHGHSLSGSARVLHRAGVTEVEDLRLQAGRAELMASGRAGPEPGLDWRASIPDLGELLSDWSGSVEGSGRVDGTFAQPQIVLSVEAAAVRSPLVDVQSAALEGRAAPLGGGETALRADVGGIATGAITVESFGASLEGTPADHRLRAELESDRGGARLVVSGAVDGPRWRGSIRSATLTPGRFGEWQLVEPVALTVEADTIETGRACLRNDEARVCASFAGSPERWRGRADAGQIPLALAASLVRDDLDYNGTFDVTARLSGEEGTITDGEARLDLRAGSVVGAIDEQPETLLAFRGGRAEATVSREAVALRADLQLEAGGMLRADTRLGRAAPHSLAGRVEARIENLGLVTVLTPAIGRMEGTFLADVELGGSLENPAAAGSATLDSGLMQLVPLGIELTRIDAGLETDDNALELTLRADSGDGAVNARARVTRAGGEWSGEGSIAGTDFQLVKLPEASVTVTPDLDWTLRGRQVDVRGHVEIPRARISPRDLSNTVQTSPDTVIVGAAVDSGEPQAQPWRAWGDVRISLGDDVRIDAFGLQGRLEGQIDVVERPDRVTEATGELRVIDGTYKIYGQTLQIERGRLLFDGGPAANPGLDVRAVRRPRDILVGVNVRGRLREPRVTLFSDPPMEESQQLSYLLFGLPLGQTSQGQQSNLAVAASALAGSEQGSRLASRFGVQELSVDRGTPGEGASLVLGRYLSPRLYVGYGIGLMEQANSVRLRYDLTRTWTIEARSGVTSSADLLYSIEVDSTADAVDGLIERRDDGNAAEAKEGP